MVIVVAEDAGQDLIAQSMNFVDLTISSSVQMHDSGNFVPNLVICRRCLVVRRLASTSASAPMTASSATTT